MHISVSLALKKLGVLYHSYSPLWTEWVAYRFHGLDEREVYLLSIWEKQNFKCNNRQLLPEAGSIECTAKKLRQIYPEFKDWVIMKFHFRLLYLALLQDKELLLKFTLAQFEKEDVLKLKRLLKKDRGIIIGR